MAPGEFMAQVRAVMRLRHLSYRTEQSYCYVIKRFICYHNKRHPSEMGAEEVTAYLTHLASDRQVSISTQHVALCALLFLYRVVLQQPLPEVLEFVRTRRHPRLPVVFTRTEVHTILACLEHPYLLMAQLLYGAGLRVMECLRLRIKDCQATPFLVTRIASRENVTLGKVSPHQRSALPQQPCSVIPRLHHSAILTDDSPA